MATCPDCGQFFSEALQRCPNDGSSLLDDDSVALAERELPRDTIVGGYRIEFVIGDGGFGTVYRATHSVIGKSAAIKVLKREFSSNQEIVSRFVAEARSVNQIRHKNIIDIFSFGVLEDGRHYYVMELLEGVTLDRWISSRGRLPPHEVWPILKQLSRALGAAHAVGITHRDLKPENVFLTYDDEGHPVPKLLDFGIAKLKIGGESQYKTRSGTPMGTPLYMSPEQAHGRPVDHRTDIYAFGILVHELLTGTPPFDGDSVLEVMTKQARDPAPAISSLCPEYGTILDAPVLAMLEKSPEKRPQSITLAMEGVAQAFERVTPLPGESWRSATPRSSRSFSGDTKHMEIVPISRQMHRPESAEPLTRTLAFAERDLSRSTGGAASPGRSRWYWLSGLGMLGASAIALGAYLLWKPPGEPIATGTVVAPDLGAAANSAHAQASPVADQAGQESPDAQPVGSAPEPQQITVSFSSPLGAEVLHEGKLVGTTDAPLTLPKAAGRTKLQLRKSGHKIRDIWVEPTRDLILNEPPWGASQPLRGNRSDDPAGSPDSSPGIATRSGASSKSRGDVSTKPDARPVPPKDGPTRSELQFD